MSQQNPLTLICPVEVEKLDGLYKQLSDIKYELEAGKHEFFENTENIHYLRWLIIDDKHTYPNSLFFKGKAHEPKLVFSSNFDGSVGNHIKDLSADLKTNAIDNIYSHCKGYPSVEKRNPDSRAHFFNKHKIQASAFYKGSPGRTVSQIKKENTLRNHLKNVLDSKDWGSKSPLEIYKSIKEEALSLDTFKWVKEEKYKMPTINWFGMILLALVLLLLLPVIIVWVLIVQYGFESKDEYYDKARSDLDPEKVKILEEYEDLGTRKKQTGNALEIKEEARAGDSKLNLPIYYQNQFSQLVEMKPGKVRLITFKAMMLFARTLIPNFMVKGELMGIPTIHFARWVLFDNNKRVLFFSNFDGSWQQYLGDFIDQSGWGLTGIFSNTAVFPKSRFMGFTGILAKFSFIKNSHFLFPGGAYEEEHFLAWSRDSELSTQIWYSAYPELSIKNVNNNSRLRVMLSKNLSNRKAKKFFELI